MNGARPTTNDSSGAANVSRLLCAAMAVALTVVLLGCSAAPAPLKKMNPFGQSAQEESLRKQVEADPFPTAKQAGLQAAQ